MAVRLGTQGQRVAFLTNAPAPYRRAMFEAWVKATGIALTVYYTEPADMGRGWKVPPSDVASEVRLPSLLSFGKYGRLNSGIGRIIGHHDVFILGGYEQPSSQVLATLCNYHKKPYILLFDGVSPKKITNPEFGWKWLLKRRVVSGAKFILANGTVGKRYMEKLGASADRIHNQCLCVDQRHIDSFFENDREHKRAKIREELGIAPDQSVVLYVGRFVPRKNVAHILAALAVNPKEKYVFIGVGKGPTLDEVTKTGLKYGIKTILPGLVDQGELPYWYAAGDTLVLPSSDEPWGLVCNEAMAAGLPIVVSDECGCGLDLVRQGQNGYVYPVGDIQGLAVAIAETTRRSEEMGQISKRLIAQWTPDNAALSLKACLEGLQRQRVG